METSRAIIFDIEKCVGCYACELACKQENNVPEGTRWIKVIPVGPFKINGKTRMFFLHDINKECNFCCRCVENCPAEAISFCDNKEKLLEAISSNKRIQICRLETPDEIFG